MKDFITTKDRLKETYLWEYREAIRSGEILAGIDMIQELDNLLEEFFYEDYLYDTTEAYIKIDFIEHNVRHTKAPFYGKPFVLDLWQKALIEVAYSFKIKSIDTDKWVKRFTEVLLVIARKNGKTTLIAAIMLTELFLAPNGTGIICSGMDDTVASYCYTELNKMRIFIDIDSVMTWKNQKGITCTLNDNFLRKISETTRSKEGGNASIIGIDEIWSLANEEGIYDPLRQSVSTQPEYIIWLFGSEGIVVDGFLDHKIDDYMKIIERRDTTDSAKRRLPWIYRNDTEEECFDTNEQGIAKAWQKANPSIGTAKLWSYMKILCDEAKAKMSSRLAFLTKDCNIKQGSAERWLNPQVLKYDASFDFKEFDNWWCVGSTDLAENSDLVSARIYMFKPNSRYLYTHSHYWICRSKLDEDNDIKVGAKYQEWADEGYLTILDDSFVDTGVVADWFWNEVVVKHNVMIYKIGYDQKFKNDFVKKADYYGWKDKEDLICINQNADTLNDAIIQTEDNLTDQLIIGLNPIDKWCLANCGIKIDGKDKCLITKTEKARRIDGAATTIMCQEMYSRYRKDVYERLPVTA